jgi:hypothetical protein
MNTKENKYVYILYRKEYILDHSGKKVTLYHYFNSTFVNNKIILKQALSPYRWYESSSLSLIEKVLSKDLDWTEIIYFNMFKVRIARIFALFIIGNWYKIKKVEIVNTK